MYNGQTNALISTLTGSQENDQVGYGGVTVLTNGNYVVISVIWNNNNIAGAGAATWGNGNSGVSGVVSSANSLVGSTAYDRVDGVVALTNGNYVVISSGWDNGNIIDAGAITWGSGSTGITGEISNSNSLVGSTLRDRVGEGGVFALANGNYVVRSFYWDNGGSADAGAVTWGNGSSGVRGVISIANSLVGSQAGDKVGDVTVLANGNYVVSSSSWDNGSTANVGAVTWGNGSSGISGVISSANSLVGSQTNDRVGFNKVTALTNSNYVVMSAYWNNGSNTSAGAVTWGNGNTGIIGTVSSGNSLVGSQINDRVGTVMELTNGNFLVISPGWKNGNFANAGAVTWGNGTSGVSGAVSSVNSLVGSQTDDLVGDVTVLTNGNYVIYSYNWDNGSTPNAGAATWGNGTTGIAGVISSANSLVGSTESDWVGSGITTALTNGNYVVSSGSWDNGSIANVGAATWGNGISGISGEISSANSLVGSKSNDGVGSDVIALTNGNYVVSSSLWDNGSVINAGAATWGNGISGISGEVSSANSLVGSTRNDYVGSDDVTALANGNYVINNNKWDNGALTNAGAVTLGNGVVGTSGPVTTCNSVLGNLSSTIYYLYYAYNDTYEKLIVSKPRENIVSIFAPSQSSLAMASTNANNTANGSATIAFVDNSCQLVATLKPSGTTPVNGSVEAKVYVENNVFTAADGRVYASRHYDISPTAYPNSATSTVTLYYTQAEFDDYNANNGTEPDLR